MNPFLFDRSSGPTYTLGNFEGPLELLIYLIQCEELDICDIFVGELTGQFSSQLETMDQGAEFLGLATTLLLMKSRKLLPQTQVQEDIETPLRSEMLQTLLEYCRFKEVATELSALELEQAAYFPRDPTPLPPERGPGLENVELKEIAAILHEVMQRAADESIETIYEETFQVEPRIVWFEERLREGPLSFSDVFNLEKKRPELIVLFLALLELLKTQKAKLTNTFTIVASHGSI